ncbi:L-sorbosone dehydrogenase [Shewanella sp. 10N.286.52.C2]|nr:L-sorbosone dehydrogenase [Shewanella sp. 10N.286.52.C2]PMG41586.1 L-sorbosone dehydrogenase [Shewanella sp. 10N.286.52.B9]PMH85400.1 L-sorbosone dehydrogenase [Shewanella sp. 10N.286.48.B5]PMH98051.1 L-sorbosone dehydrogenase [Shewanella sp. 10N.286.48.A6]
MKAKITKMSNIKFKMDFKQAKTALKALSVLALTQMTVVKAFAADTMMITVTKGFGLTLYASDLGDAKQMAMGTNGTLFVGSKKSGTIYALVDSDNDGQVNKRYLIGKGLEYPEAIAFHDGDLYVADQDRILRYQDIEDRLRRPGRPKEVYSGLPSVERKHARGMKFGPDGRLYISIGSPCNVCEAEAPFSSMLAIDIKTGDTEQVASGLRRVIGFDWSPSSAKLWFADQGRNWMGDTMPADEINRIDVKGSHFGFPYIHGTNVVEPSFKKPDNLNVSTPEFELPAHVKPTSLLFYQGDNFPERYHHQLFVAENGSWNRSSKIGYQVVMLALEDDQIIKRERVVSFLDGEFPVARPYDLINAPDGAVFISDDLKGNVYRLFYKAPE